MNLHDMNAIYALVSQHIAIETAHLYRVVPVKMVTFHIALSLSQTDLLRTNDGRFFELGPG